MAIVTLVDYQHEWPERFREAASELQTVFAGLTAQIEHVGSTSVAGLCAKPVLDILLGAQTLAQIESRGSALAGLGYRYRPEYEAELPERRYFVRQEGSGPRIHLHAVVFGSPFWQRHLAFRDALRGDPNLARRYGELKRALALAHAHDRAAYTDAKGPFIAEVLSRVKLAGDPPVGF